METFEPRTQPLFDNFKRRQTRPQRRRAAALRRARLRALLVDRPLAAAGRARSRLRGR